MNTEQQELLRHAILTQLDVAYPASLPFVTIQHGLSLKGFPNQQPIVKKELAYLCDKKLITNKPLIISRSISRYKLTTDGLDYLQSSGLA